MSLAGPFFWKLRRCGLLHCIFHHFSESNRRQSYRFQCSCTDRTYSIQLYKLLHLLPHSYHPNPVDTLTLSHRIAHAVFLTFVENSQPRTWRQKLTPAHHFPPFFPRKACAPSAFTNDQIASEQSIIASASRQLCIEPWRWNRKFW